MQAADEELQQLRIRNRQIEGESIIFQTQIDELKQEIKLAAEREDRDKERRGAMVDAAVNTEVAAKGERATNTEVIVSQHKETCTEQVVTEEKAVNTTVDMEDRGSNTEVVETAEKAINTQVETEERAVNTQQVETEERGIGTRDEEEQAKQEATENLILAEDGTETISEESSTQLLQEGPTSIHEVDFVNFFLFSTSFLSLFFLLLFLPCFDLFFFRLNRLSFYGKRC